MRVNVPTIGVMIPTVSGRYFGHVMAGVQKAVQRHGLHLIVVEDLPKNVHAMKLASDRVSGWVVVLRTEGVEDLVRAGRPVVTVSTAVPGVACSAVLSDNAGGMYAQVKHLIEHGHQRIAFAGWLANDDMRDRYEGYKAALIEHGLTPDDQLLFMTEDAIEVGGRGAGQRLLEAGVPCTAIVAASDQLAIGIMEVLGAAGYRFPDDLAIVGFDDMAQAQVVTPPLTTVRQSFDALGETAVELMLAQLAGKEVAAGSVYLPTALIQRRSCGCKTISLPTRPPAEDARDGERWQEALARHLVERALFPRAPDPNIPPDQIWPGAAALVRAIERAIHDDVLTEPAEIARAWGEAVDITPNIEILDTLLGLLEQAGKHELDNMPPERAARAPLTALLHSLRRELMRAVVSHGEAEIRDLRNLVRANSAISIDLFGEQADHSDPLAWLAHTPTTWGSLLMWDRGESRDSAELLCTASYCRDGAPPIPIGSRYRAAAFPPRDLIARSSLAGASALTLLIPIRTAATEWGVLALNSLFEIRHGTDDDLIGVWATLMGATFQREALQATLRSAYEREHLLADIVRDLGSPIIPLMPGVLLVPLIGAIDTGRAQQILTAVLKAVGEQHATEVLFDITGVPLVDTQVANSLIQTARAVTLLGARSILVGVRPEIAQSIVGLGVDLGGLVTWPTLAEAIRTLR